MPSTKDPSIVQPGPGKLAAGQVPASAIAFPFGGAGDLAAHIADPIDAHMSGAIGIPEVDPVTGQPLLSSAGGPYDGESVLDALRSLADLIPVRPDRIGFNTSVPNSGMPNWSNALTVGGSGTAEHGGWTDVANNLIVTKYLTPNGSIGAQTVNGIVYPADRGVLAVYRTNTNNFFDAGATTLVGAIWLGPNPAPAGIPSANFVEGTRGTGQTDVSATNSGINRISLIDRLPYLSNYPGSEYTPFDANFSGYQLAKFSFGVTLVAGANSSYMVVHWRESFASTLAAIQPANLTVGTLIANNCYSAVPSSPAANFDAVTRKDIFVDTLSAVGASPVSITTTPAGNLATSRHSGIFHYNNVGLQWSIVAACDDLFDNSFRTNAASSVLVPVGFESLTAVVQLDTTDFGGVELDIPLFNDPSTRLRKTSNNTVFSASNIPDVGDQATLTWTTAPIGGTGDGITFPYAQVKINWMRPFVGAVVQTSTQRYLFNSVAGTLTTQTFEPFNNEGYRHVSGFNAPSPATPIIPAGGNAFNSTTLFAANDEKLQVLQGRLVYPGFNFSAAPFFPVTAGGNYAAVRAADTALSLRRYVRAFNTGVARNTGVIRLRGLATADFVPDAAFDGNESTGHLTGGAIVQIRVPGSGAWLDLGRDKGDPDLGVNDFKGCATGFTVVGPDVFVSYDTTGFTADNGSGEFLLFIRVSFVNNAAGYALALEEIEWQATL